MRGKEEDWSGKALKVRITPAYAGKSVTDAEDVTASEDHPRLCGEKFVKRFLLIKNIGSPPPMRGKAYCKNYLAPKKRITPAYAGKRVCDACGEEADEGSPPPMRGKEEDWSGKALKVRITPAYAGKRACGGRDEKRRKDHPRLCGEKLHMLASQTIVRGSPPPMRGKAIFLYSLHNVKRITPAYAGKSPLLCHRKTGSTDHPRLCGEKRTRGVPKIVQAGSPPPMRGKVIWQKKR